MDVLDLDGTAPAADERPPRWLGRIQLAGAAALLGAGAVAVTGARPAPVAAERMVREAVASVADEAVGEAAPAPGEVRAAVFALG